MDLSPGLNEFSAEAELLVWKHRAKTAERTLEAAQKSLRQFCEQMTLPIAQGGECISKR
jgi:hypothetical protein